jgi:exopolyphosphatase/guanosine-5'-triphosphate,3'-diphosphate pyrophosphatase
MIEAAQGQKGCTQVDRTVSVERFALACGTDDAHGQHVAQLAGTIFSQLQEPFQLASDDRWMVETAARLQDVGYLIDYDRHHKHSYHLILNSQLEGISPEDLEIIANVARYHRGAEPKKKHAHFERLDRRTRKRVRQLAAILRLAGGLDRSHSQVVDDVIMDVVDGGVEMRVQSASFPEVDLWGARRRSGLFEKVFDTPLTIEWSPPS